GLGAAVVLAEVVTQAGLVGLAPTLLAGDVLDDGRFRAFVTTDEDGDDRAAAARVRRELRRLLLAVDRAPVGQHETERARLAAGTAAPTAGILVTADV